MLYKPAIAQESWHSPLSKQWHFKKPKYISQKLKSGPVLSFPGLGRAGAPGRCCQVKWAPRALPRSPGSPEQPPCTRCPPCRAGTDAAAPLDRRGAEGGCARGPPRAPGQLLLAAGPRLVPECPGQGQPAAAALRGQRPTLRAAGAEPRALSLHRDAAGGAGAARGRGQAQDSAQYHRHPPGHAAAQAPAPPEAAADAAAPLPQGVPAAAQLPHPHQEQVPRIAAGQQDRRSSFRKVSFLPDWSWGSPRQRLPYAGRKILAMQQPQEPVPRPEVSVNLTAHAAGSSSCSSKASTCHRNISA